MVIVDKDGVRIEPIRGGITSAIERLGETIPHMMETCMEKCAEQWGQRRKEGRIKAVVGHHCSG